MTFKWGFADISPALNTAADNATLFSEAATVRPQLWRVDVAWNYIAIAQQPGTAGFDSVNNVPTTTGRDWTTVDRYLNDMLLVVGCDVLMMIGQARPSWGGISWLFGWGATIGSSTDYQNFCAEVATRYQPGGVGIRTDGKYAANAGKGVTKFEFWNEENNSFFWGNAVSPGDVTDLIIKGNAGIKSVLPGAASTTVFGGLQHVPRSAPWFGYGWITMDELTFLSRCYDAAVAAGTTLGAHYDVMAEHVYTQTDTTGYGPSTVGPAPDPGTDNLEQLVAIRNLMVTKGDGAKPIWITECGFSTNVVSQALQSTYMQELFTYFGTLSYIGAVFIYNLRDTGTDPNYVEDNWGMETYGWVHKAIWSFIQTLSPIQAAMTLSLSPAIGIAAEPATSFGLSVTPSLAMIAAERYTAAFGLAVTPTLTMVGAERYQAAFGLSVTPSIGMAVAIPGVGTFGLAVTPTLAMVGGERYSAAFGLSVTPSIAMLGAERYAATFGLSVTPAISTTGAAKMAAAFGLSITPSIGMTGAVPIVPPTYVSGSAVGGGGSASYNPSISTSLNVAAGTRTNGYALIVIAYRHGGQAYSGQTTTCTYGGNACTKVFGAGYASDCSLEVWEYFGPPSASTAVVASCGNGANTGREIAMDVLIFNGVASRSSTVTSNSGSGSAATCSVAPTSQELPVLAVAGNATSGFGTPPSGMTALASQGSGASFAEEQVLTAANSVTSMGANYNASVAWQAAAVRLHG